MVETCEDKITPTVNQDGVVDASFRESFERNFDKVVSTINTISHTLIHDLVTDEPTNSDNNEIKMNEIQLKIGLTLSSEGNVWLVKGSAAATIEVTISWKNNKD